MSLAMRKPSRVVLTNSPLRSGSGSVADTVHQARVGTPIFFFQIGKEPRELIVLRYVAHEAVGARKIGD